MNLQLKQQPFLKRPRVLISGVIVVLLLGWAVWQWIGDKGATSTTRVTQTVERGNIENLVTATGILQPRDYVDVGAQVSGQLKVLHVDVGSNVKKGDLLAEIDATLYLASVDASRAQLRNQKAQMSERQASLKLAESNFRRQQNLFKEEATTREAFENAEASLAAAKAQIESLSAQIQQTESSLRAEEAKLEYASIYAPMDGTVVSIAAKQGQTLNANQTAPLLMRLADLSVMTVKAQVSEADVGKIKAGMDVYFTTLGSEGRRWYSTLSRIEPTPENLNNVILYNALFDVPNDKRELMSDMTAQVFFVAAQAKNVLTLPMAALTILPPRSETRAVPTSESSSKEQRPSPHSGEGGVPTSSPETRTRGPRADITPLAEGERRARVNVITASGSVEEKWIVVGVSNRVTAEIKSGLNEGDVVVLNVQGNSASGSRAPTNMPRGPMGPPGMMR